MPPKDNTYGWTILTSVAQSSLRGGDRLRLTATGSNPVHLQAFVDGALMIDYYDSTYLLTGGQPGIMEYDQGYGAIEAWSGGNGSGAGIAYHAPPVPWAIGSAATLQLKNKRVVDGVTYLDFTSGYNGSGALTLRYLQPSSPANVPAKLLYILPVEDAVPGVTYGDGMDTIRSVRPGCRIPTI